MEVVRIEREKFNKLVKSVYRLVSISSKAAASFPIGVAAIFESHTEKPAEVRCAIQWLQDFGYIRRTEDLTVEQYTLIR